MASQIQEAINELRCIAKPITEHPDVQRLIGQVVELQDEIKKLKVLLGMAVCPNCDGSGAIPRQVSSETRVSRDMASDAGMPELEGSIYTEDEWEAEQCQWCDEKNEALKGNTNDH